MAPNILEDNNLLFLNNGQSGRHCLPLQLLLVAIVFIHGGRQSIAMIMQLLQEAKISSKIPSHLVP